MPMTVRAATKVLERWGHDVIRHLDADTVEPELKSKWRETPAGLDASFGSRLVRDRTEIVPWLNGIRNLNGARVLEIGCGEGISALSLAEQGAAVTGVDVDADLLANAESLFRSVGLSGSFHCLNATEIDQLGLEAFDFVIFWACLEHMTIEERLEALGPAWALLRDRGHLVLVETPNRLWPSDSHTSNLPFFSWLPDALAFEYARFSRRPGFGDIYDDPLEQMLHFLRRGRGVSFHEFDLALEGNVVVASCMQLERRRRNPVRNLAWALSGAGRTERVLRSFAPERDRAWFQPFLYLALRKG